MHSCKIALLALTLVGCSASRSVADRDAEAPVDAPAPSDAGCVVDCGPPPSGCTVDVVDCTCRLSCSDAGPSTCEAATASLRDEMYGDIGNCVTLVRLDYASLAVVGWQLFCRPFSSTGGSDVSTEDLARAVALRDTGHGGVQLGTDASSFRVFFEMPTDFGGIAVIGTGVAQAVFGGGIVWAGRGEITYPLAFRDASELGSGCAPPAGWPDRIFGRVTSYELGETPLPDATVRAVLLEVARTSAYAAAWAGGYVFETTVLLYPRTVGGLDPAAAEYIVLIASGWLE